MKGYFISLKKPESIDLMHVTKIALLIVSLLFTFLFVMAGTGNYQWGDPLYWLWRCKEYDGSFMTIGTIALGHGWMLLFGDTIFALRLLSWLCVSIAILLPYFCLLDNKERRNNLHYLAIAYFLSGYGTFQEYSPGSISVLLVSILFVLWMRYLKKRNVLIPIVLCVSAAIVSRFPNVVLLLVLFMLILINGLVNKYSAKRIVCDELFILGGTLLTSLCLYLLLGCELSFQGFNNTWNSAASGGHSMHNLFFPLLEQGVDIWVFVCVIIVFGRLALETEFPYYWVRWIYIICLSMMFSYYLLHEFSLHEWYNIRLHIFISSLTVAVAFVYAYDCLKKRDFMTLFIVFSMLLMGMVVSLGSDTGWLKLFPMYLCFLPFMLGKNCFSFRHSCFLWLILVVFVVSKYMANPIGGIPMWKSKCFGPYPYNYTLISNKNCDEFNQFIKDYNEFGRGKQCVTVGLGWHMFSSITSCPLFVPSFYHNLEHDDGIMDSLYHYMESEGPVVFLMNYHEEYPQSVVKEIGNNIKSIGYEIVDREDPEYLICYPKVE